MHHRQISEPAPPEGSGVTAPPATLLNGDKCDIYNGIREAVTQHTVHGFSGDPAATPRPRVRVKPALFPLIWCIDVE